MSEQQPQEAQVPVEAPEAVEAPAAEEHPDAEGGIEDEELEDALAAAEPGNDDEVVAAEAEEEA
jgi:hypothetical protein